MAGKPIVARALSALVVDDNDYARALLAELLTLRGCRVVTAKDGSAALALANAEKFDIFFVDFRMPQLDCLDLAIGLRRRGCTAPIVLVTGDAHIVDEARRTAAGIQRVVAKPYRLDHIAACLDLVPKGITP